MSGSRSQEKIYWREGSERRTKLVERERGLKSFQANCFWVSLPWRSRGWRTFSSPILLNLQGDRYWLFLWRKKQTAWENEPLGEPRIFRHKQNVSFIVSWRAMLVILNFISACCEGDEGVAGRAKRILQADLINGVINGANFTWTLRVITSCFPSHPSLCLYRGQCG